jgi:pyruvate dehydrogenase E1 component alpha subunit
MPLEEIGNYSVTRLQVLDEQGKVDSALEPDLSDEQLMSLYRNMVMAREADQRMLKLQRQGRIGTFGPCTGQEASICGTAMAMGEKDWFVGAFREAGARMMRGEPFLRQLVYYNGFEEGNYFEGNERLTPVAVIVAAQLLHAVGIGYSIKYKGEKDTAVVTVVGDGGTSEGDFHEALNFASVWQVPVVFIVQNNQWAISHPRSKQTNSKTFAQKAIAYDMPGIQVDGNDALAVYRAVKEGLDRAYTGGGPSLIETDTYRLMMHTTADDPTKYRDKEGVEAAWKREPLIRFKAYLENKGLLDEEKQAALDAEVKAEIDAAVKELDEWKLQNIDQPFEHVFGDKHPEIAMQQAEFLDELSREEGGNV